MRERHWLRLAGLAGVIMTLTACVPSTIPAFDRAATEQDALPDGAEDLWPDRSFDNLGADEVRHAVTWETADLFFIRQRSGDTCLFVWDPPESVMACGGGGMLGLDGPKCNFEMHPAPIGEKDGWTVISENIRVEDK